MGESKSYIWFQDDKIKEDEAATIFKCRHKRSGRLSVVKVPSEKTGRKSMSMESDVLKSLNHQNIVKFLALEEEVKSLSPVIIMEFCTDGNLSSYISTTENAFGLCEADFLAVLRDICAAALYLRNRHEFHCDIKPRNILRTIGNDGKVVHKLTNFVLPRYTKSAKPPHSQLGIDEDVEFDEYTAWYVGAGQKMSTCATNCWSIGVTMYECITGSLPFRAHKCRNEQEVLLRIYKERAHDQISGIQTVEGPINWSTDYPEYCRVPRELLDILLPIQRKLFLSMEDEHTSMSLENFFEEIQDFLRQRKLQFVDVFCAKLHNLYLPENISKQDDIKKAMIEAAGMGVSDILLLSEHNEIDLSDVAFFLNKHGAVLQSVPDAGSRAEVGKPMFVFCRDNSASRKAKPRALPQVLLASNPSVRQSMAAARRLKLAAEDSLGSLRLVRTGMVAWLGYVKHSLMDKAASVDRCSPTGVDGDRQLLSLRRQQRASRQLCDVLQIDLDREATSAGTDRLLLQQKRKLSAAIAARDELMETVKDSMHRRLKLMSMLQERVDNSDIVDRWICSSCDLSPFERNCSRIQRLCYRIEQFGAHLSSEQLSLSELGFDSLRSKYERSLFQKDCSLLRKIYRRCDNASQNFVHRTKLWKIHYLEPYLQRLHKVRQECEDVVTEYHTIDTKLNELQDNAEQLIDQVMSLHVARHRAALNALPRASESMESANVSLVTAPTRSLQSPPSSMAIANQQSFSLQSSTLSLNSAQRLADLLSKIEHETMTVVNESKRLLDG